MRILFDECMPPRLRREIIGHEVRTVAEMGWLGKKNGELLRAMAGAGFEVMITVDQNLRYQQNLRVFGVGIIVLVVRRTLLASLISLMPSAQAVLDSIQPGEVVEVTS